MVILTIQSALTDLLAVNTVRSHASGRLVFVADDSIKQCQSKSLKGLSKCCSKSSSSITNGSLKRTLCFASCTASPHLSAVCYLVLAHLALDSEDCSRVGEARKTLVEQVTILSLCIESVKGVPDFHSLGGFRREICTH